MPEVAYATRMHLSPEVIWDFVKEMDNWAPFLTGYQKHEKLSETDSVWTLKGDVGVLSRMVQLKFHVTEWNGPSRVTFTLTGLNESVDGEGSLAITTASAEPLPEPPKKGLWARLVDGLFGWLFRLVNGKSVQRRELGPAAGRPTSQLTFTLRMDAGGPTGPLVNAMLAPALRPAAEDLANKIAAHLEDAQARGVVAAPAARPVAA
jgi:carbon monoxide dehydrogenase subunit G